MAFYPPSGTLKELTLTKDVQLDYPYSADTSNVIVADVMDVSTNVAGINVFLPNSTLTGTGFAITFNNVGLNNFNIVLNDKLTILTSIPSGIIKTIYLYNNATVDGSWRVIPFGGGISAISTLNLDSDDASITIANGHITAPGGDVNIKLPNIISLIQNLPNKTSGIVVVDPDDPLIWKTISLTNGVNLDIDNASGVAGNPIINLKDTIALTQIKSGNIVISNDLITNANSVETLAIISNGSNSNLNLNNVFIDNQSNVSNIKNLTVNGAFNAPNVSKVWCRFNDVSGTITTTSSYNVTNVTYSSVTNQYTINFTTPMANLDYCVFISCANNNSIAPLQTRMGYDVVKQMDSVSIVLTDASGEILPDIPEGVSVVIYSLN